MNSVHPGKRLQWRFLIGLYRLLLAIRGKVQRPLELGNDGFLELCLHKLSRCPDISTSSKIALYGAGQHTRRILKLRVLPRARFVAIFDDKPTSALFETIPVHSPTQAAAVDFDGVMISSDVYAKELAKKAEQWLPKGKWLAEIYTHTIRHV